MLSVASLVLPLFTLIGFGYVAGRYKKIPIEGLAWLNYFIIYFSLPALFFRLLAATPMNQLSNSGFLVRTSLVTLAVFLLCFCIARFYKRVDSQVATIQGFSGAYGNIGYLGPPLVIAAFGPEAGVPLALIFCIDNSMHFTLAPLLMALGGKSKQTWLLMVCGIFYRIFTHPFIVATIFGITAAWFQFEVPKPIDSVLVLLASAAAPCALFAMGVTAALRPLKRVPIELFYLVPVKLLIHPLLMYLVLKPMASLDEVWLYTAVLLAALPAATNVFVIAQQYGVWEERASSAVVVSTFLSIFTLTAYLYLARGGVL